MHAGYFAEVLLRMAEKKTKELELMSRDVNSSQWARTTNLPVCYESSVSEILRNRVTAERATNCASEDAD
jgi:hypothetical protein